MAARVLTYAAVLWIVADADPAVWPVALVALPLALLAAAGLGAPPLPRVRPVALLAFVPFFAAASLRGGVDVALRALSRRPRVNPALISYTMRLRGPTARVMLADALSLLPGTLCADVRVDELVIHTLDRTHGVDAVRALEVRVAAVFGEELVA